MTIADHLISAAQHPDDRINALIDLEGPPLPWMAEHGWRVFLRLNKKRTSSSVGPQPISYGDMLDYCELTGDQLTPLDIAVIDEADAALAADVRDRMPAGGES